MRFFVALTDFDWFRLHASKTSVEEVNFWRPSPEATFKALTVGEPFLFKLHAPRNFIAGGVFFTRFLRLPISLAWDAFGEGNGARTLEEVRHRIGHYRSAPVAPAEDPNIGCILLAEPFFFPEPAWIPAAPYFLAHTQVGKRYSLDEDLGRQLWDEVRARLGSMRGQIVNPGPAMTAAIEMPRYGKPVLTAPRLGQGAFRVLVTDAYGRRCAMTQERTLPVLEAAHIRPYRQNGPHDIRNGLCLRSDLHRLLDKGYLTINPDDRRIVVSRRIKDEYDNGEEYYPLHGRPLTPPADPAAMPSKEYLVFHAEHVFR